MLRIQLQPGGLIQHFWNVLHETSYSSRDVAEY